MGTLAFAHSAAFSNSQCDFVCVYCRPDIWSLWKGCCGLLTITVPTWTGPANQNPSPTLWWPPSSHKRDFFLKICSTRETTSIKTNLNWIFFSLMRDAVTAGVFHKFGLFKGNRVQQFCKTQRICKWNRCFTVDKKHHEVCISEDVCVVRQPNLYLLNGHNSFLI